MKGKKMTQRIPLHSLVLMVGPSCAGKSTIANKMFDSYEIVSSDATRDELVGDETRKDLNHIVFSLVKSRIELKLTMGERVVVDATNIRQQDRRSIYEIGLKYGVPIFYIVVNRPLNEKLASNNWKTDGSAGNFVARHDEIFLSGEREILRGDNVATVIDTRKETFTVVKKIKPAEYTAAINDRGFSGVMVLGDVHGMRERLKSAVDWANARNLFMIFLGDVIDYGPHSLDCINIVYDLICRGRAAMTIGNHERKIERWLVQEAAYRAEGTPIRLKLSEGNLVTTRAFEDLTPSERVKMETKFTTMVNLSRNHIILDDILLTHGGAEPEMFKLLDHRLSRKFESVALYGETDNTFTAEGYPNRTYNWVNRIPKGKTVIVGHDIRSTFAPLQVTGAENGEAIFLDTGSGKGGHLTTAHIMRENDMWAIKAFTAH